MAARIILNPTAGNGKAQKLFELIQAHLPNDVEVVRTTGPGHATELARQVADQEDLTVVSLGGDGTHHEVINGLMPEGKTIFAVLPAGTGNDFVRTLGYPKSPRAMLDVALYGAERRIDVGRVNDEYFLTVSGVGFDAEVAGWVNQHEKKGNGTWIFLRGILRHLVHFQAEQMTIHVDGAFRSEPTFLLAAGNSPYYAGGMKICPEADPGDGLFHVVWVKDLSRLGVLPLLTRVFRGTHVQHPQVKTFQTEQLTVEGPPNMLVHADGEIVGHLPVTMTVIPAAIRVRTGRS
ncbi:diacylglycerol/lipid kinase family protein [Sulfobacillus harzensis]|uniref:Diacylglycerol kinase family lipid kinase n=1 Tax=Sulfobacillus harzensis TaxID=2729629 RepID=A0A7Y0L114_9FIRM|nr:diacylglycerol kinase family protein [Sulfobacillus harzensis]NMP21329.1 diacylglycerol kinase family lipid kinase [Sulfobacillus harzensis]